MNRFPAHFHETKQQPLRCHTCDNPLTETESDHYWNSHLRGEGDPYCVDCASQIEVVDFNPRPDSPHQIPWMFLVLAFVAIGAACAGTSYTGYAIVASFACINLAILARVCRW